MQDLIAAVQRALDETDAEYGQLPFFVRPMVRHGFVKRTGLDFARWRAVLSEVARGTIEPGLPAALAALGEHYRGAPERARKGMGATAPQLAEVEARSRTRAEAVAALAAAISAR
ncbi:MAG: hypothetical protein H0T89_04800 [Deltaproteobacteria bacterium]|nr:hypothetical protein [Deltaproteobacteria bacterium]MDQ3300094.1 hypothetical protein [Myxococcota bacterium]